MKGQELGFQATVWKVEALHRSCAGEVSKGHLGTDHGQCFALSGVHFSRHDAAARLIFWKLQLPQAASRAAAQKSDVVRYLHQRDCNGVQSSRRLHNRIMRS